MPLDATRGFMENLRPLDRTNEGPQNLFKIVIACDKPLRTNSLTELQRMNISSQTLFPWLGGLASDLENQMLMDHPFQGIGEDRDDIDSPLIKRKRPTMNSIPHLRTRLQSVVSGRRQGWEGIHTS